jgi:hypothetical protein
VETTTSTGTSLLSTSVPLTEVEALYVCVPGASSVTVRVAVPPGPMVVAPSDFDPFPSLLEMLTGWPDNGLPLWSRNVAVMVNGVPAVAVSGPVSVKEGFSCAAVAVTAASAAAVTGTMLTETGSLTERLAPTVATAWNVTFPTADSVLVNVADPSLAVVAVPTVTEPPSPARWKVMSTPVRGVLLLTSVAMRVNDWLTVASAGPVKVSVGLTPVTLNGSIVDAEVDELLEGGGKAELDEDEAADEVPED